MNPTLPEDWNPNKPIRLSLAEWDYELADSVRSGVTMYETWHSKPRGEYCMVLYRWDHDKGYVPFLVSTPMKEFPGVASYDR